MKLTIKNHEIELVYSIRTNILYESILGKSLKFEELSQIDNLSYLFYANILSTLQANKVQIDVSWDDFIEYVDANGGIKLLGDYAVWLAEQMNIQVGLYNEEEKEATDKAKNSKKKS